MNARIQVLNLRRPACKCGGLCERNGRGDGYRTVCARCRKRRQKGQA